MFYLVRNKSGELVEVSEALRDQLIASGKRTAEDFQPSGTGAQIISLDSGESIPVDVRPPVLEGDTLAQPFQASSLSDLPPANPQGLYRYIIESPEGAKEFKFDKKLTRGQLRELENLIDGSGRLAQASYDDVGAALGESPLSVGARAVLPRISQTLARGGSIPEKVLDAATDLPLDLLSIPGRALGMGVDMALAAGSETPFEGRIPSMYYVDSDVEGQPRGFLGSIGQGIVRAPDLALPSPIKMQPMQKTLSIANLAPRAGIGAAEGLAASQLEAIAEQRDLTGMEAGLSAGLPGLASLVGPGLRQGAVRALTEKIKPNKTKTTKVKYKPEMEDVFTLRTEGGERLLPLTGGSEGILDQIETAIMETGQRRSAEVRRLMDEAAGGGMRRRPDGSLELPEGLIDREDIARRVQDVLSTRIDRGELTADEALSVYNAARDELINVGGGLANPERGRFLSGVGVDDPRAMPSLEGLTPDEQSLATSRRLIPLDRLLGRRSEWFRRGKVNTKEWNELPSDRLAAYNLLFEQAGKAINENPALREANQMFARLLPLEDAIMDRRQAQANKFKFRSMGAGLGALRDVAQSNPALRARYAAGVAFDEGQGMFPARNLGYELGRDRLTETPEPSIFLPPLQQEPELLDFGDPRLPPFIRP